MQKPVEPPGGVVGVVHVVLDPLLLQFVTWGKVPKYDEARCPIWRGSGGGNRMLLLLLGETLQYGTIWRDRKTIIRKFVCCCCFFVGGTQTGAFQLGVSAPKVEMQKVKITKNRSCCCRCICRNRPPKKLRPPKAEQKRVAKPNPAIINYSRKFTQDLFDFHGLTTSRWNVRKEHSVINQFLAGLGSVQRLRVAAVISRWDRASLVKTTGGEE